MFNRQLKEDVETLKRQVSNLYDEIFVDDYFGKPHTSGVCMPKIPRYTAKTFKKLSEGTCYIYAVKYYTCLENWNTYYDLIQKWNKEAEDFEKNLQKNLNKK